MDDKKKTKEQLIAELKKLRKNEEIFFNIFNTGPMIMTISTVEDGIFLDVNDAFVNFTGYSREECIGRKSLDLDLWVYPEDRIKVINSLKKRGSVRNFEISTKTKSGEIRYTLFSSEYLKIGSEVRILTSILDITERKKAEKDLIHSHDLMSYIIEHNRSAVAVHDKDLNYIYVSQRYLDDFNVKKKDIIGKHHYEIFPDLPPKWRDVHQKALAGEISSAEDDPYVREDGKVDWTRWECRPWYEADGSIGGIIIYTEVITERKQAEEALREEKERAQNYLDIAGAIIVTLNNKGEVSLINQRGCELLCYSQDEIVGKNWLNNFLPKRRRKEVIKDFHRFIAGEIETFEYYENPIVTKNGDERLIAWHNSFIYDKSGKINGTLSSGEDITERKSVEEKLQYNIALLEAQLNSTLEGILIVDKEGKKILQNQRTIDLWKIPQHIVDNPDGKTQVQHVMRMTKNPEKFVENIIYLKNHPEEKSIDEVELIDGTFIDRYSAPVIGKDGNNYGRIWTFRDITEHKKAEEALRESESRFRLMFNNSNDAILVHKIMPDGTPGKYIEANEVACQRYGYSKEELLQMKPMDLVPPESMENLSEIIKQLQKVGHATWEGIHITKDGSPIAEELSNSVFDFLGKPLVLASARDITEHKQLEEEQAKASKLESIGLLAGGIAHDFNNILASILGNTSLAKLKFDRNSEEYKLLTETENATVNATKLTQQLLTFAKGGAPVKEITEISELIRETTGFSLRGSNVHYRTTIAPDLSNAFVDKGQISQVIRNLVINAKQAMPKGGTIKINAKNVIVTPNDKRSLREGHYIRISVADKGNGISAAHLTKIFDPYYTTKQMGSGLGLATCYSIIRRHDGHIEVKSKVGVGTIFTFYLPASEKKIKSKKTAKEETAVKTGKILVMDDDDMLRRMVTRLLENSGNEVIEARDGVEAIKKYKMAMKSKNPVDVVIMDLTIPGGMGGKEAIKKLLEIDPNAKVIVSSGYANDPVVSYFDAYGFKGYIPKPYMLKDFMKVLNRVLSLK
ncbi:PAS domain S-box protein [Candidatus Latescibacterota bacterium]